MKIVVINVEQRHIDEAIRWNKSPNRLTSVSDNCPIARAVSEILGFPVAVGEYHIRKKHTDITIDLPKEVSNNSAEWYLSGNWPYLKPFSFNLVIND